MNGETYNHILNTLRVDGYQFVSNLLEGGMYPLHARKMTDWQGIKVCYNIFIRDEYSNVCFDSVSILGHKYNCMYPSFYFSIDSNFEYILRQFVSYTENNIKENIHYYNYDNDIVSLFTNDYTEGIRMICSALRIRDRLMQEKMPKCVSDVEVYPDSRTESLTDKMNENVEKQIIDQNCVGYDRTLACYIPDAVYNNLSKRLFAVEGTPVLTNSYEHIILNNKTLDNEEILDGEETVQVDDIHNIKGWMKNILCVGFIAYSIKHRKKFVYLGDGKWKPFKDENKVIINKDKLLNVERNREWKRI